MGRRGFTIVELLVVIAILAILAAMVLPVIMQAKESAHMGTCASNMRQLGCAIAQYIEDNSGYGLPPSPDEYENAWILCPIPLEKYVGQKPTPLRGDWGSPSDRPRRVWVCPGDFNRGPAYEDRPFWWHCGASYLYPGPTAYISGTEIHQKENVRARRPYSWRNHKRDMLLADAWFDFHSGRRVRHDFHNLSPPAWVDRMDVKSINVIFLDLHVKSIAGGQRDTYITYVKEDDNPFFPKH